MFIYLMFQKYSCYNLRKHRLKFYSNVFFFLRYNFFILRLDERFGWEIRVHMVTQKCVKFFFFFF